MVAVEFDFQKGKTKVKMDVTVEPRGKLRRACKKLRRALGLGSDESIEITVKKGPASPTAPEPEAAPQPPPEIGGPIVLKDNGELAHFLFQFTGDQSVVRRESDTVKDLVRALDASSYQRVSAYIHRLEVSPSMKIRDLLRTLDELPAAPLPVID